MPNIQKKNSNTGGRTRTTIMNMEVEQEPMVLQIKGILISTFYTIIPIDYGNTHTMMSISFTYMIGLPLVPIKPCLLWLPNNQPSFITRHVMRVHVNIQRMNTKAYFEIWDGARYEIWVRRDLGK